MCTRVDVVPVPDRLEHRVGEPKEEDLLEAHLAEVVVDPVDLRLVEVLVQLGRQGAGRGKVVTERLLHDDTRVRGQAGARQPLDDRPEQCGRDLQVVDGALGLTGGDSQPLVRGGVREVALDVREARREAREHSRVEALACPDDRGPGSFHQLVHGPGGVRDPDDRAVEQTPLLESIQRSERHHLGQVARDAEDDEDVGRLARRGQIGGCQRENGASGWRKGAAGDGRCSKWTAATLPAGQRRATVAVDDTQSIVTDLCSTRSDHPIVPGSSELGPGDAVSVGRSRAGPPEEP